MPLHLLHNITNHHQDNIISLGRLISITQIQTSSLGSNLIIRLRDSIRLRSVLLHLDGRMKRRRRRGGGRYERVLIYDMMMHLDISRMASLWDGDWKRLLYRICLEWLMIARMGLEELKIE
jgi:hypothetical protein